MPAGVTGAAPAIGGDMRTTTAVSLSHIRSPPADCTNENKHNRPETDERVSLVLVTIRNQGFVAPGVYLGCEVNFGLTKRDRT